MLGLHEFIQGVTVEEVASRIDHAVLKPSASNAELEKAIEELEKLRLRCLILTPTLLREARGMTQHCLGAVVGFPYGYATLEAKVKELEDVIGFGANEADIVANTQALLLGRKEYYVNEIRALIEICKSTGVKCKIIIETPILGSWNRIVETVRLIVEATTPDYLKTSTGFAERPTYPEDVAAIAATLEEIGLRGKIGVKAAGGVRTGLQALQMFAAGADIIGTSKPRQVLESLQLLREKLVEAGKQ